VHQAKPQRLTMLRDRTKQALRRARSAESGAEFHHGLIPIAWSVGIEQLVRGFPQAAPFCQVAQIPADRAKPRKHASDITVEDGAFFIKRDACNCRCGVFAYPGECNNLFALFWKVATEFANDLPRCFLQISRAAVVTKSRPQSQDFFFRRFGQRLNCRESFEESIVVGNHGGDARLLQHDLRKPDAIRIFRSSPRQVALKLAKPTQKRFAKRSELATGERHGPLVSHTVEARFIERNRRETGRKTCARAWRGWCRVSGW